jgi:hypothetical protein
MEKHTMSTNSLLSTLTLMLVVLHVPAVAAQEVPAAPVGALQEPAEAAQEAEAEEAEEERRNEVALVLAGTREDSEEEETFPGQLGVRVPRRLSPDRWPEAVRRPRVRARGRASRR